MCSGPSLGMVWWVSRLPIVGGLLLVVEVVVGGRLKWVGLPMVPTPSRRNLPVSMSAGIGWHVDNLPCSGSLDGCQCCCLGVGPVCSCQ